MPPANRHDPTRTKCSDSTFSLMEFMRSFPDDAACLEHLWRSRCSEDGEHAICPKCDQERSFKRYQTAQGRQSWTCTACGHHLHPTAGTIFAKSSTSLHLWYYAMYLMTSTRCGISAKQLERELGVSYPTAWRMMNKIRNQLMTQTDEPLSGDVEADETWIGGKPRAAETRRVRRAAHPKRERNLLYQKRKVSVFGAVERGGQVRAVVIPDSSAATLGPALTRYVLPSSAIFTDEWKAYEKAGREFEVHYRIQHKQGVYVNGTVHTNTIEGFWSTVKNGIRGVYHSVSKKWLQGYLNEYAWRYNHRPLMLGERAMFEALIERAAA